MRIVRPGLTLVSGLSLALIATAAACGGTEPAPPPTAEVTAPGTISIHVYFLSEPNFSAGVEPFVVPVEREVRPRDLAGVALEALFAGPTPEEEARGLRLVASGATGFADLAISDSIARLRLTGGCDSRGSIFTVAQEIIPTLTQFPEVSYVKIYGSEGDTAEPEGPGNSIPGCLEP